MLATLFSRRSDGGVQKWSIEVDFDKYRTISGVMDGQMTTSEWTRCVGKGKGAALTTRSEQALKEAKALATKKRNEGYHDKIGDIDTEQFFAPMLAHVYDDYEDLVTNALASGQNVSLQPKLDGMRCVVQVSGMTSRNGKIIAAAPHVYKQCFGEGLLDYDAADGHHVLDGELYTHKYAENFNKIISLAKKQKPTASDLLDSELHLQYHVYDLPSVDGPFSKRWKVLHELFRPGRTIPSIKLVETVKITRVSDIEDLFGKWRGEGYEGAMIRLEGNYEKKRSRTLLKYKKLQDAEFEVLDVVEGKGNRAGMAGSLLFKTKGGKLFHAAIMGDTDFFRKLLQEEPRVVGKQATVQFQNLTPDGLPRFPYVKCIRDYE